MNFLPFLRFIINIETNKYYLIHIKTLSKQQNVTNIRLLMLNLFITFSEMISCVKYYKTQNNR
jgi:hypothetical protein